MLHDWGGRLTGSEDGAMNPVYAVSTVNGKALGAGEPLRVRTGEHLLLHILNSSPTEVHWVALAGHKLQVVALDGNPVSAPRSVPMLRLAPAERVGRAARPAAWTGSLSHSPARRGISADCSRSATTGPLRKFCWTKPANARPIWSFLRGMIAVCGIGGLWNLSRRHWQSLHQESA